MLLLESKLVLGRVPILLADELGGDVLPQLSTFIGELLLEGAHNLGNGLQLFEVYQRVELCRRRDRRAGSRRIASPSDAISPTTIEEGDDARLRDMFDLCPFLVFGLVFVIRVDNTFDEEMGPPKPRLSPQSRLI